MYISRKTLNFLKSEYQIVKGRLNKQVGIVRQAIESGGGTHDNATYDAALHKQNILSQKEEKMRNYLNYNIIDELEVNTDVVSIGNRVGIIREDTEEKIEYLILGPPDSEFSNDKRIISYLSPIGQQPIGKSVGSLANIRVPAGEYKVEILEISKALSGKS